MIPNKSNSSPSQVAAIKMSSVWVHWNVTYGGAGVLVYLHQNITYKNVLGSTPVHLATRVGPFGVLEKLSAISDQIDARIDVISHNSTLVVHKLQYNDSGAKFSPFIEMQAQGPPYPLDLAPVVTLHVKGKFFQKCRYCNILKNWFGLK